MVVRGFVKGEIRLFVICHHPMEFKDTARLANILSTYRSGDRCTNFGQEVPGKHVGLHTAKLVICPEKAIATGHVISSPARYCQCMLVYCPAKFGCYVIVSCKIMSVHTSTLPTLVSAGLIEK